MFLLIARWVPASGIVFAVLVIIANLLESPPGRHASNAAWTAYYADAGNRHKEEISFFLVGLAGLFFLQFLGSLRGALARAEGEPARITTAAIASGVAFVGIAISAHAVGSAISWSVSYYGSSYTVDPQTARLLAGLGFGLFVMSLFGAAAMALATTTLSFHTRVFPIWLSWLGVLATIGALIGIVGFTSLVTLLWILVLSGYLAWPRKAATTQQVSPPAPG
jgi:hypothetical protein